MSTFFKAAAFIFLFCCVSAADMALCFVLVKNKANALIKVMVNVSKPQRNVGMYGRFAHIKTLCRRADGRLRLYDIFRKSLCPFFNKFIQ